MAELIKRHCRPATLTTALAAILQVLTASAAWGQTFKHDENNRLAEIAFPEGKSKRFVYDSAGNLLQVVTTTSGTTGQGKLPHTGITESQCYQAGSNTLVSCSSPGAIALSGDGKQDGMYTDVNPMSYSRVGSFGLDECVKDNVTGLMWEGKTTSGLRAGSGSYTNWGDGRSGDASEYVAAVNATALCGYSDWRLPTVDELETLVDASRASPGPTIRSDWFPNTATVFSWASSPDVRYLPFVWGVRFYDGLVSSGNPDNSFPVRLVRASQ